jgi:hypothetical protein
MAALGCYVGLIALFRLWEATNRLCSPAHLSHRSATQVNWCIALHNKAQPPVCIESYGNAQVCSCGAIAEHGFVLRGSARFRRCCLRFKTARRQHSTARQVLIRMHKLYRRDLGGSNETLFVWIGRVGEEILIFMCFG